MKPARGSSRSSTRGPKGKVQGETLPQTGRKPLPSGVRTQDKSRKVSAVVQKGQEKWKPLDKSSIIALDTMLNMSILSTLMLRRRGKEESQKQLNLLKEQFLAKCSQLPVPVKKCGNMIQMSRQFHVESQKIAHGKTEIEALEGNIRDVVDRLELLQQQTESLQETCRLLRARVEGEEERALEFFQVAEQAVLHLPALPPHPDTELTVQEQMLKTVPDPSAVMRVLQNDVVGSVRGFLELANEYADKLVTPPVRAHGRDDAV